MQGTQATPHLGVEEERGQVIVLAALGTPAAKAHKVSAVRIVNAWAGLARVGRAGLQQVHGVGREGGGSAAGLPES